MIDYLIYTAVVVAALVALRKRRRVPARPPALPPPTPLRVRARMWVGVVAIVAVVVLARSLFY